MFVSYLSGVDARFTVSAPAWQNSTGVEKEHFVQITEALISEPGKSGVLFSRRWTTGQICWHFTSRSIRQKESMVNRFRHFVVPFTDGYTNVLRSIITRSAHQRRWYYAGCGNNMKEHRYDVCCCSARRVFAIRESASWLMKNVRNWWIYCNRPGRW